MQLKMRDVYPYTNTSIVIEGTAFDYGLLSKSKLENLASDLTSMLEDIKSRIEKLTTD